MATARPLEWPALPAHPIQGGQWSHDVIRVQSLLDQRYTHISGILRQEDHDQLRLQILAQNLLDRELPLLEALDTELANPEWAVVAGGAFASLITELHRASQAVDVGS